MPSNYIIVSVEAKPSAPANGAAASNDDWVNRQKIQDGKQIFLVEN